MTDHLYYGHVPHDHILTLMKREATEDEDLTTTVFVLALSRGEAEELVREKYRAEIPMALVPSGVACVSAAWGSEVAIQRGIRGDHNWTELEECPECGSNGVHHDAHAGATDCANCGWSKEWV